MYYTSFPFSNGTTNIIDTVCFFIILIYVRNFLRLSKNGLKVTVTIEPVFNLYFASVSMFNTYSPERFLSLVRGIEVFHRRSSDEKKFSDTEFENIVNCILSKFPEDSKERLILEDKMKYANEITLRKRIKKMIHPFASLYGSNQRIKSFIKDVVDTRNYLTHYDSRLEENAVTKEEDLYKLCIKLEALFQLHFLKLIEIDMEFIMNVAEKNNYLCHKVNFDGKV